MTDIRRVETLMRGHEARPFVLPARWSGSWYRGPFLTMGNRFHGDAFPWWYNPAPFPANTWWQYPTPWFKVFAEESPSNPRANLYTATNTRIQTRNIRLFLRRSSWTLEQTIAAPISDQFSYDMVSLEVEGGHRDESANGGGTSHRILNGGTRVPHGYGVPHFVSDPWNITGVAVDMDVRLIRDDPEGTDDRANARCVVAIACDLFFNTGKPMPAIGYWCAVGCAGFARVTNDWQRVGFNSYFTGARPDMDVDALRAEYSSTLILASSPPGWTDGGGGSVITPTPAPTTASKLFFFGDAYVRGDDAVAGSHRSWRGKALGDLTAAGLTVDSVGREVLASVGRPSDPEHEGYTGARFSTTTNNLAARLDAAVAAATGTSTQITAGAGSIAAAVLMAGLTDYESEPTGIADRFSALFNSLQSALPTTPLVVVTLPPRQGLTEAGTNAAYPGYAALNSRIRQIAGSTYGVRLAEGATASYVSGDYQSASLLLQSGADKLGAVVAGALRLALGGGAGYIIPGAPTRPTVSLRLQTSRLHVFRWGVTVVPVSIDTTSLPVAPRARLYSYRVPVSGVPAPVVTITGLPAGLSASGANISGTATAAVGSYTVTVTAGAVVRTFTLRVVEPPTFTTTTLPTVSAGSVFRLPISATGTGALTVALADRGTLPVGVDMDGGDLVGSVSAAGAYTFTALATDADSTATQALTLTVAAAIAPVVTTASLPPARIGEAYSVRLEASGTGPFVWTRTGDTLWTGLTIQGDIITGTPAVQATGTRNPTVNAIGPTALTGSRTLALQLLPALVTGPVFSTGEALFGTSGSSGSTNVVATGSGAVTYARVFASDASITVSSAGAVQWTAGTAPGTYLVTVSATDAAGGTTNKSFVLTLSPAAGADPVAKRFTVGPDGGGVSWRKSR
jgi:hypothetical protein